MSEIKPTIKAISELLFIESSIEKVDLIIVLGNNWTGTMAEVARFYYDGITDRILITGKCVGEETDKTEASKFKEKGLECKIPEEAFLLEENATNTKENIQFSAKVIEENIGFDKIKKILFIVKAFHARRVLMTAKKDFPPHIEYFFHSTVDERNIQKSNWWEDPAVMDRTLAEVRRIGEYALKGDISLD